MKKIFTLILGFCFSLVLSAQDTLVGWTFPTGTANDSVANFALPANSGSFLKTYGGTTALNYSTNGLTTFSAQATGWDSGMNTKYWQIEFSTAEYQNIKLSSILRSGGNNPGPRDFQIQYKVGMGVVWTDVVGGAVTTAANWTGGAISNLSLPADVDNQTSTVYIRWIMATDDDINGNTVLPTGIAKMDNIIITGNKINVGIYNVDNENIICVYPNPAKGSVSVLNAPKGQYQVFNSTGQIMTSTTNYSEETTLSLDMRGMPAGIYFCKMNNGSKTQVSKIILLN